MSTDKGLKRIKDMILRQFAFLSLNVGVLHSLDPENPWLQNASRKKKKTQLDMKACDFNFLIFQHHTRKLKR